MSVCDCPVSTALLSSPATLTPFFLFFILPDPHSGLAVQLNQSDSKVLDVSVIHISAWKALEPLTPFERRLRVGLRSHLQKTSQGKWRAQKPLQTLIKLVPHQRCCCTVLPTLLEGW